MEKEREEQGRKKNSVYLSNIFTPFSFSSCLLTFHLHCLSLLPSIYPSISLSACRGAHTDLSFYLHIVKYAH